MRNFVLVASLALITFALVAPSFAAPSSGCDDDEKVKCYDESNNEKKSNYASGDSSADKVDVSCSQDGVDTKYGSDKKETKSKSGDHQECDNSVSIEGDQGSSYKQKSSSKHTGFKEGGSSSDNSYYSSKPTC